MAGKGKARAFGQGLLVDGQGAERRGGAPLHQIHAGLDGGDRAAGVGGIEPAGHARGVERQWMDAEPFPGAGTGLGRILADHMGDAAGQVVGVADPEEGQVAPERVPGGLGQFGTDARRFAATERDGSFRHWSTMRASERSCAR